MHMLCQLDWHRPSEGEVWNHGFFFSFCARCGCDLVRRSSREWRRVRPPMKVVWRERRPFDMPWMPDVLPAPDQDLPIAPEWRALIARRSRRSGRAQDTARRIEPAEPA